MKAAPPTGAIPGTDVIQPGFDDAQAGTSETLLG